MDMPLKFMAVLQASAKLLHAELWFGETALASCGCKFGISNAFVSAFFWLNEFGSFARELHSVVVRQTLVRQGNRYSLFHEDMSPTPDFWASFFWKQLMRPYVHEVSMSTSSPSTVRTFVHSLRTDSVTRLTLLLEILDSESSVNVSLSPQLLAALCSSGEAPGWRSLPTGPTLRL